jgi:hypothetical protein
MVPEELCTFAFAEVNEWLKDSVAYFGDGMDPQHCPADYGPATKLD